MVPTVKIQSKLEQHFRYLGLNDFKPVINDILKWYRCNGATWTVNRLKLIKTQFIHITSGQYIDREWVSYKGVIPRGSLGPLFRFGLIGRKQRKLVLSALNAYLVFIGKNEKKTRDVLDNIARPILDSQRERALQLYVGDRDFFTVSLRRSLRRAVVGVAYHDSIKVDQGTGHSSGNPFGQSWTESLMATRHCILPTESVSGHFVQKRGIYHPPEFLGELVPLYERGDKVRIVAMPYAEIQLWLKPLHSALNKALEIIKEDCTFDQIKGARYANFALREGRIVHSVDLSAATDRFPYVFQEMVLRNLFPDPDMVNWGSVYARLVNGTWSGPYGPIRYGAGQPMGTYGSFALFALAHHALLHSLCLWFGVPRESDGTYPYRILGDDIVIANQQLYDHYIKKLSHLGVSVSASKSINSAVCAEFAGFLIDKKGFYKPTKPAKYRLDHSKVIQYLQISGENHFSGSISEVAELMKFLPEPFGAGLNPMGQSSVTRLNLYGFIPDESDLRESIPEVDILSILNSAPRVDHSSSWVNFINPSDTISFLLTKQIQSRTEIISDNGHILSRTLETLSDEGRRQIIKDGPIISPSLLGTMMQGVTNHDKYMYHEDMSSFYRRHFPLFPWK